MVFNPNNRELSLDHSVYFKLGMGLEVTMKTLIQWLKGFVKRHIVDDFPYPDPCFDCNKGNCAGCPIWVASMKEVKND